MIKAVIFDMDDTLYPEHEYVISGFKAVDTFLMGKKIRGFYSLATNFFKNGNRGRIFNEVLDTLNISYEEQDITELINIYRNHFPEINLFEDARRLIEDLSSEYPLGLITDGYVNAQRNKVKALKIQENFKKIVLTDELGRAHWKPSSLPYEIIKDYFNVNHSELVYIGDNINKDFVTANKLGWTTIQVIRESGEYYNQSLDTTFNAKYQVKSLLEVKYILNMGSVQSV